MGTVLGFPPINDIWPREVVEYELFGSPFEKESEVEKLARTALGLSGIAFGLGAMGCCGAIALEENRLGSTVGWVFGLEDFLEVILGELISLRRNGSY